MSSDVASSDKIEASDWKPVTLGKIARIVTDGITAADLAALPLVHHYSLPAFDQGAGPEIGPGETIKSNKTIVPSNCVLFSKLNPRIPRIWRISGVASPHSYCSTEFWPLVARDRGVDLDYLTQYLGSDGFLGHPAITPSSSTNSHQRVDRKAFERFEFLLPPLDEQRRIAEVLRSVDEAIAAAENVATQAYSTLDALLFDYFSVGGSHASASNLGLLSDLIVVQSGFAFKSEEYQRHGHFLMRISNVQDGQISLERPQFVKLDKKTQAFELQKGDILTSLTGNIGRVARITADHLPAALNQRVARIKPKAGASIDADYLFFVLKSPLFKAGLADESGGAAQQNVSPKAIGRVEIPVPSMDEQRSIGQLLSAADEAIVQSKFALGHLQAVQVSLMSDLLSGRVRVPA